MPQLVPIGQSLSDLALEPALDRPTECARERLKMQELGGFLLTTGYFFILFFFSTL
jgi:hypothetical protein